ncbi:APC family permease [Ghiorsea bivora]|uniref:APC family permease n=1 Tax=Ghiorsea bivora TaxID=1485545 RepID=UPI00068A5D5E|nr:APC family permease [Ghiorsea bivora]
MNTKTRNIGLLGAISIGIGGMVGGGIFAVLGEAVSLAHGATAIAFLFAGIVALLTAYAYSKLSVTFQNRGGTVVFIDQAFQHNLLSSSVNLMLWLSYLVTIALYASAFASYGQTFLQDSPTPLQHHFLITIAIILPAIINLISTSFVSRSEFVIVLIKVSLLILIIISGVFYIDPDKLSPNHWESPLAIVTAGMIIFVAYEGFELIANATEDIKSPEKNLPKAFFGATLFVILLYVLISLVTVGVVPEAQLLEAKDYALAIAAKPALGNIGFTIVAIAALLSTFSAINATIYGNARLGYFLAKEGELPHKLSILNKNIPSYDIIVISLLSIGIANTISLNEIAIIGSAGFLLIFTIVNLAAFKLRHKIHARTTVLIAAFTMSLAALLTLLIYTYNTNPKAIIVFASFITIAILFELLYGVYIRKHFFKRNYHV